MCVIFEQLEDSHVLVYHYTSMQAAQVMMKLGIPVFAGSNVIHGSNSKMNGVIFSLKGPQSVKQADPALGEPPF
jgi:hypothetical protein